MRCIQQEGVASAACIWCTACPRTSLTTLQALPRPQASWDGMLWNAVPEHTLVQAERMQQASPDATHPSGP